MRNTSHVLILTFVSIILAQCVDPNLEFGNLTMVFCPSKSFLNDTMNNFQTIDLAANDTYVNMLPTLTNQVNAMATAQNITPDYDTCFAAYKNFLCITNFKECNQTLPCVIHCLNYYVSCGFNGNDTAAA
jgi:hypothetical protein